MSKEKWHGQTYDIKTFHNELDNDAIKKENQDLREEKRTLEASLEKEITKQQKLGIKLDTKNKSKESTSNKFGQKDQILDEPIGTKFNKYLQVIILCLNHT